LNTRKRTKYVHEGRYVAEVDVQLLNDESGWAPYLTIEDACRLDHVREALRKDDVSSAVKFARVFTLQPVAASIQGNFE
jgi:hypothetical protein